MNYILVLCDELDKCVANQIPVIMVVAVVGSTEESAVDPLVRIIELRDHYCYKKVSNCCRRSAFYSKRWESTLEFLIIDTFYLLIRIHLTNFTIIRTKSLQTYNFVWDSFYLGKRKASKTCTFCNLDPLLITLIKTSGSRTKENSRMLCIKSH